jgi:hypothetical protein
MLTRDRPIRYRLVGLAFLSLIKHIATRLGAMLILDCFSTILCIIIIVPLSTSAQHVSFFHSLLSLVISMLMPFIFMSSFTQSIHLFLGRPLLGCPSTFIVVTFFIVTFIPPHNMHTKLTYCFSFSQSLALLLNFPLYYACYIHKTFLLNHFYLFKQPHRDPLGSFKDLSIHRDRQRQGTLFYTML